MITDWTKAGLICRGWRLLNRRTNGQRQCFMLCPWYEFQYLPDGTELWHISGVLAIKGKDQFNWENRAGVLGYGIWVV